MDINIYVYIRGRERHVQRTAAKKYSVLRKGTAGIKQQ